MTRWHKHLKFPSFLLECLDRETISNQMFCNNYSFSFNPFHLYSFILHNFHIIDLFFKRKVDSFASTPHAIGINLEAMVLHMQKKLT